MTGHPLSDRIRTLNRRARTYRSNGVAIREPNSATRADCLTAEADRLTVRSARAQLIQHARRRELRGKPVRPVLADLALGNRVNIDTLAGALIAETGVYSCAAPAAERLLVHGQPAPTTSAASCGLCNAGR